MSPARAVALVLIAAVTATVVACKPGDNGASGGTTQPPPSASPVCHEGHDCSAEPSAGTSVPGSPSPSAPNPTVSASVPVPTFTDKPPQAQYREIGMNCTVNHRLNDDPVVFPGQPGVSHNHSFVGNPSTDANTTTAEKLVGGQTSCQDKKDASAYWFPTLMQNGTVVNPETVTVYYKSGVKDYRTVQPFPAGFRLLVGDMRTPSAEQFGGTWNCTGYLGKEIPPSCPSGSSLIVRYQAPSCWDGVHLDTSDHKSHMAFPVDGRCTGDHPVPLPMFEMKVPYKLPGGVTAGLAYSSGPSYSFHYDFMNGWDQQRQAEVVAHCINGGRQCNGLGVDRHKP
ncbi:hypothetical protein Val02_59630 [Virgisporangium aliadipatigenens]|uniref:DUF1996 domain-containing protein n=1 Tax=Virgisporangium aliadipatigenens TaxID=741659 RepID=A0A8J4DUD8_9ACTN|nr:DUF1996 domain-containing protein [Virgisporangium aliadipatigenens]GIJ49077.1 hypothetical protein Val02_59630 [Virgisporangium aliadipatigenens]